MTPYQLAAWKTARVNIDYHVEYKGIKVKGLPAQNRPPKNWKFTGFLGVEPRDGATDVDLAFGEVDVGPLVDQRAVGQRYVNPVEAHGLEQEPAGVH